MYSYCVYIMCIYILIHICTYVCMYIHVCICICIYIITKLHIYIYNSIYIYTPNNIIYIYIHAHFPKNPPQPRNLEAMGTQADKAPWESAMAMVISWRFYWESHGEFLWKDPPCYEWENQL